MCAIRFFYGTTLGRPGVAEHIPLARKAETLPAVLTRDQVVRFLKAVPDLEMRTIFITIYSAGLRVAEAVALTARDIDMRTWSSTCGRAKVARTAIEVAPVV
jgi:integrase/recombinase XerD